MRILSAVDFYERHPISSEIILSKLRTTRGVLTDVSPEQLFAHDQDHYGGLDANDALARLAEIGVDTRVVDFCAGLGGPARYFAHKFGAKVTGIELTPARVRGAEQLSELVGLQNRVNVIQGDVMEAPLPDESCDVVVSQEALLHVADKKRALQEAYRLLVPGGRLAFTDWIAHRPLSPEDTKLMWDGMAVANLYDATTYAALIAGVGFTVSSTEDLTDEWSIVLRQRLAMYQQLRSEAIEAQTPQGHDAFYESYVRLVDLVNQSALGGMRFAAIKPHQ
jgi:ubiquinone/menaquinone biosynthesis C-methylase UbiE